MRVQITVWSRRSNPGRTAKVRHTVKVKPSVKKICNKCRVIRRRGYTQGSLVRTAKNSGWRTGAAVHIERANARHAGQGQVNGAAIGGHRERDGITAREVAAEQAPRGGIHAHQLVGGGHRITGDHP